MKKFYFILLFSLIITCGFGQIQSVRTNNNSAVVTDTKAGYDKEEPSGNNISGESLFAVGSTTSNYIQRNATNQLTLVTNVEAATPATLTMHSIYGQLIVSKNLNLVKGSNNIELPSSHSPQIRIVSFYVGNQLMFTQKVY